MKISELLKLRWTEHPANPLIAPPFRFPAPIIADPTFLPPDKTPDGRWHLFAHTLVGILHFVSDDGLDWQRMGGVVSLMSLRPFLFRQGDRFRLYYERWTSLFPWRSRIDVRSSTDLIHWSKAITVMTPDAPYHRVTSKPRWKSASNPCLVLVGEEYRLYHSAGLVYMPDQGFYEPEFLALATSNGPLGPFEPRPEPLFRPTPEDRWGNLASGAMKVLACEDGYVGFQNSIYWRDDSQHSGSALRLLTSADGISWQVADREPIIKPDRGWKKTHVYALDVRPVGQGKWHLYFNARDDWRSGKEHIGLAVGE